jgi:hypothetical protein
MIMTRRFFQRRSGTPNVIGDIRAALPHRQDVTDAKTS